MKPHFSEADLLETYYTRPGESMPVMMHLADCPECAARYERLEAKMRGLHSCHHEEKPETFWVRQRMAILRRIDARRERRVSAARVIRFAAAAMLLLIVGTLAWERVDRTPPAAPAVAQSATQVTATSEPQRLESTVESDPWASDELDEYSAMVQWEAWVDEEGDQSS